MSRTVFSDELTRSREAAVLTQTQLAARASVSLSSLNRWEKGGSLPKRENAEILDRVLSAEGRLLARLDEARDGFTVPPWARDLASIEPEAQTVEIAAPGLVPGYLQSPGYASALFRAAHPWATDAEIDRLVRLRCQRLGKLPDLRVTAVFPVSALDAVPRDVRAEQVTTLQEWAHTERVTLHLVPAGHVLMVPAAPVMVFRFTSGELAVSCDYATGTVLADVSMHARLTSMVSAALASALPAALSLEVLEGLRDS